MKIKISHRTNLTVIMEGERKTVELTFPKVQDTDKLKSLIKTAQLSSKKDKRLMSWLAVYFLIYEKMPKRYWLVPFDVIRQMPISKLTYLPSLFTSLDKIAEVI